MKFINTAWCVILSNHMDLSIISSTDLCAHDQEAQTHMLIDATFVETTMRAVYSCTDSILHNAARWLL